MKLLPSKPSAKADRSPSYTAAAPAEKTASSPLKKQAAPAPPSRLKRTAAFLSAWRPQIICVAAGFLLCFLSSRFLPSERDLIGGSRLSRPNYGGSARSYEIVVEGLGEGSEELTIPVAPRSYLDEELNKVFASCMEELSVSILNGNLSLSEICTDLSLPSELPGYGIRLSWHSSDPEILSSFGEVRNDDLTEPRDTELHVNLREAGGSRNADFILPVTILPPSRTEDESLRRSFLHYLEEADLDQAADAEFRLPEEYNGRRLYYSQRSAANYSMFWIGGILIALLLKLRDKESVKNEAAARRRELLLDYPEIVSKLMVFLGAGMTLRSSWEHIVTDYETSGGPKRHAYEEMTYSLGQLKTGTSEGKVYHEFGRRTGLPQYMKLAGILEQNRKTGLSNIRTVLGAEMHNAWEERKNMARRLGEEAGTRLLGPLFIMLIIVMVMIIVPALLTF